MDDNDRPISCDDDELDGTGDEALLLVVVAMVMRQLAACFMGENGRSCEL